MASSSFNTYASRRLPTRCVKYEALGHGSTLLAADQNSASEDPSFDSPILHLTNATKGPLLQRPPHAWCWGTHDAGFLAGDVSVFHDEELHEENHKVRVAFALSITESRQMVHLAGPGIGSVPLRSLSRIASGSEAF